MTGRAENMIIAALDQDYASCVEVYDRLTVKERSDLAEWILGNNGDIANAPMLIREQCRALSEIAFLEVGLRWAKRKAC